MNAVGGESNYCRLSHSHYYRHHHQSKQPSQHQHETISQSTLATSKNGKRLQTPVGMLPVRLFLLSSRLIKDFNFINSKGIVPESSLLFKSNKASGSKEKKSKKSRMSNTCSTG